MKVLCFGDTHNSSKFEKIVRSNDLNYDLALCLGDFIDREIRDYSTPKPTYTIFGNHDTISVKPGKPASFSTAKSLIEESDNITHLREGRVYAEKGFKLAGINGNFSPKNFDDSRQDSNHPRHFTRKAYERCLDLRHGPRLDFFLSHEAPYGYADLDWRTGEKHYGIEVIRELLETLNPRFFLTGHIHSLQAEFHEGTWVINVGYGVDGEFVIIDFDERRIKFYENGDRRLRTLPLSKPDKVSVSPTFEKGGFSPGKR